jgi:hypothetical protein
MIGIARPTLLMPRLIKDDLQCLHVSKIIYNRSTPLQQGSCGQVGYKVVFLK